MPAIIAMIVNLFGFFKWGKVVDFVLRGITFAKMVIINGLLFASILAYVVAVLVILNFIYTKFNYIVDYINNLSVGNDKIITTSMMVLKSLGAWNALCDVFAIFSPVLLSFFVIYATKIGIFVFKNARDTLLSFVIAKL
ncbi:fatty acid synthesis protein [Campylobacter concisus]|uniref:fatty acid synthesis protein n=1 Tax=Campylobacter concisus TaxID=199 RepID=UPI000CD7F345|nr:fatty acid synthesis protein [Campylobacter concisus]